MDDWSGKLACLTSEERAELRRAWFAYKEHMAGREGTIRLLDFANGFKAAVAFLSTHVPHRTSVTCVPFDPATSTLTIDDAV